MLITGPTTGVVELQVTNIRVNDADVENATKGDERSR